MAKQFSSGARVALITQCECKNGSDADIFLKQFKEIYGNSKIGDDSKLIPFCSTIVGPAMNRVANNLELCKETE